MKPADLLAQLALHGGEPVELIERHTADGSAVWLLAPVDRQQLHSPLWRHIRLQAPLWASPEAALMGFALKLEGWKRSTNKWPSERIKAWLSQQLEGGPVNAARLIDEAAQYGIHPKRLQRAAQYLKVRRQKVGFGGAWWWSLPEADEESMDEGERRHGYQYKAI